MNRTIMNINECFFILLYSGVKKEHILTKIKNTLDDKEFEAVSIFIDWIQKRHIDRTDKNLFDVINFFNEDLIELSLKILSKKRNDYLREIIKMVSTVYRWDFHLDLRWRIINYTDWRISF